LLNSGVEVAGKTAFSLVVDSLIRITYDYQCLQFIFIPKTAQPKGNFGLALLSVPLYAFMSLITGIVFTFFMDYPMGQGIYLGILLNSLVFS
jgi:hypothetical protein